MKQNVHIISRSKGRRGGKKTNPTRRVDTQIRNRKESNINNSKPSNYKGEVNKNI
jgi:hypothetical protein